MPTPIPDWDLARRLVKFIGMKQVTGEVITVREASRTLGIGRERIISVMDDEKILYKIISDGEPSGKDFILIEYVPHNLAMDAGLANSELHRSFQEILERYKQGEIKIVRPIRTRLTRKKREQMRISEFWHGPEPTP